jgi:hypothetical protein
MSPVFTGLNLLSLQRSILSFLDTKEGNLFGLPSLYIVLRKFSFLLLRLIINLFS